MASLFAFVLTLAAGAWLPLLLMRRRTLDLAEVLVLALCATLGVAALSSTLGYLSGNGLVVVQAGFFGGLAGSAVSAAIVARRPGLALERGGGYGVVLAALGILLATTQGSGLDGTTDNFYHAGAVREIAATGQALATSPLYRLPAGAIDPTTGSWHSLGAVLARLLGDPVLFWRGLTALGVLAFVLGFWTAVRRSTGSPGWASGATAAFVFAATGGVLVRFATPGIFAPPLVLVAMVLLASLWTTPSPEAALATALVGLGVASTHLGMAQLLAVGWVAVAVSLVLARVVRARAGAPTEAHRVRWQATISVAGTAALAAATLLPRLRVLRQTVVTGGPAGSGSLKAVATVPLWRVLVVDPTAVPGFPLFAAVVAVVVLGALGLRGSGAHGAVLALAFALVPLLVGFDPLVTPLLAGLSTYTLSRVMATTVVAVWAAVSWGAWRAVGLAREAPSRLRTASLALSALAALALAGSVVRAAPLAGRAWLGQTRQTVGFYRRYDVREVWGAGTDGKLRSLASTAWPTVVGLPVTQYQVAGVAPFRVLSVPQPHTPFSVTRTGFGERERDTWRFMSPRASEQERRAIAEEYDIRYVVLEYPTTEALLGREGVDALRRRERSMLAQPRLFAPALSVPGRLLVLRVLATPPPVRF